MSKAGKRLPADPALYLFFWFCVQEATTLMTSLVHVCASGMFSFYFWQNGKIKIICGNVNARARVRVRTHASAGVRAHDTQYMTG